LRCRPDFKEPLTIIVHDLVNGIAADPQYVDALLVPLPKPDGTLRPIALGEVFLKLAEKYVLKLADPPVSRFQYGCGRPRGAESVIHAVRHRYNAGHCIVSFDARNAYNCVDRAWVRAAAAQHPQLAGLFNLCYARQTKLLSADGQWQLWSRCGVRQGSTLSSILFCLVLDQVLNNIAAEFPSVEIFAYMDDVTFTSPDVGALNLAAARYRGLLSQVGLELNDSKCFMLHAPQELPTHLQAFERKKAGKFLGAYIGEEEECLKLLKDKLSKIEESVQLAKQLPRHASYTILRECIVQRPTFLARTHHPTIFANFAKQFDAMIAAAFVDISACAPLCESDCCFLRLPLKDGGAGFSALEGSHTFLYAASLAEASCFAQREEYHAKLRAVLDSETSTKRLREMNCVRDSWRWIVRATQAKWSDMDFAGAIRHRYNLLPKELAPPSDASIQCCACPFCSNNFTRGEWPAHIAYCSEARANASRNRKHRAIADSASTAIIQSSSRFHLRSEPREYATSKCPVCKAEFTDPMSHLTCPGRPRLSGPDLKIEGPARIDVIDFTVIHANSASNKSVALDKLVDNVKERKASRYVEKAAAAGHFFSTLYNI
jgi:hypothetical protein